MEVPAPKPVEKDTLPEFAGRTLRHFRGCPNQYDEIPDMVRVDSGAATCVECGAQTSPA